MHKILIALLIAFGVEAAPVAPSGTPSAPTPETMDPATSTPAIVHGNQDEIELVGEAVRRFTDHGMQLPAVEITFSETQEACDGFRGLYWPADTSTGDQVDRITICDEGPVHLYHELAHAWEHHAVADGTRAELLRRWNLSTWSDQSEDWDARGIERAAKIISYALAFEHLPVGLNVRDYVCEFDVVTGTAFPAGIPYRCGHDAAIAASAAAAATPAPAPTTTDTGTDTASRNVKDPADDPREASHTVAGSPDDRDEVPWSWEHDGPGSNSLDAPWLWKNDTP
jgi:hypothetical protein